jgi:hypothetical protein
VDCDERPLGVKDRGRQESEYLGYSFFRRQCSLYLWTASRRGLLDLAVTNRTFVIPTFPFYVKVSHHEALSASAPLDRIADQSCSLHDVCCVCCHYE